MLGELLDGKIEIHTVRSDRKPAYARKEDELPVEGQQQPTRIVSIAVSNTLLLGPRCLRSLFSLSSMLHIGKTDGRLVFGARMLHPSFP